MAVVVIPSINLQDTIFNTQGLPAAGYWVYFYDNEMYPNKRWAYRKNEEGEEIQVNNPLQLDSNGNFPYKVYYKYDDTNPDDRYRLEIRCKNSESCLPDHTYVVPYVQNVKAIESKNAIISDNLFIDGQFNISLNIEDRGKGAGFVLPIFPALPISGTSWKYLRPYSASVPIQDRTDVDRVFVRLITEAERIQEGNPKYYCNIICESFSSSNPPLQKSLSFVCSNVLWGSDSLIKIKFYAWRDGADFDIKLVIVRNYGKKSTKTPDVIPIKIFTIDSGTPKVYSTEFNLENVVIPSDNGNDGYLAINFTLPLNKEFNLKATNFYLAKMASTLPVSDFIYPIENPNLSRSKQLQSSLASNTYTTDNSMQETAFSINGYIFLDNIGEIVNYPRGALVDETKINLMKCDGRTLDANGINASFGVEYKRLYDKLGRKPRAYNILQTEETPNWFNAISSAYIKQFASDNKIITNFGLNAAFLWPSPEGSNIANLWLETTFFASTNVDSNFQYVKMGPGFGVNTVCCHTFDITSAYSNIAYVSGDNDTRVFGDNPASEDLNIAPYFRGYSTAYSLPFATASGATSYVKGIDSTVARTKANFSIKDNYFYLTININKDEYKMRSGFMGCFAPSLTSQSYNIGFPIVVRVDTVAARFGVAATQTNANLNYFLFSPWSVFNMQQITKGSQNVAAGIPAATPTATFSNNNYYLNKSWGNKNIYTDQRTANQPSVLFGLNNSVITYAIQHKALFTQRCLYALKIGRVAGGDWIGLKTQNNTNTGDVFDVVVWWKVGGSGSVPQVTAGEFRELNVPIGTSVEALADKVANEINNKGNTIFNIPNIPSDNNFDYYIRF